MVSKGDVKKETKRSVIGLSGFVMSFIYDAKKLEKVLGRSW